MVGRLISGMAVTDKHELVVVDLRAAYLVDPTNGRLVRVIGGSGRGSGRLVEPLGAATSGDGRLVFSDRADQSAKLYTARGQHVRTLTGLGMKLLKFVYASSGKVFLFEQTCCCCCSVLLSLALTCPRGQILSPWPWPWP